VFALSGTDLGRLASTHALELLDPNLGAVPWAALSVGHTNLLGHLDGLHVTLTSDTLGRLQPDTHQSAHLLLALDSYKLAFAGFGDSFVAPFELCALFVSAFAAFDADTLGLADTDSDLFALFTFLHLFLGV